MQHKLQKKSYLFSASTTIAAPFCFNNYLIGAPSPRATPTMVQAEWHYGRPPHIGRELGATSAVAEEVDDLTPSSALEVHDDHPDAPCVGEAVDAGVARSSR